MDAPRAHLEDVVGYWDAVADRYLELFRNELSGKAYDRGVLEAFATRVGDGGRVCDAGCGPCGHVARFLADRGLKVLGVDVSPRCVALARKEQPLLQFEVSDMGSLGVPAGALDGLVSYYSVHYQPKATMGAVFRDFARVLRPGGQLLVVAKEGRGEGWIDDPMGSGKRVYWAAFAADELEILAARSGFEVGGCVAREPQPDEIAARRIYLTATRDSRIVAP